MKTPLLFGVSGGSDAVKKRKKSPTIDRSANYSTPQKALRQRYAKTIKATIPKQMQTWRDTKNEKESIKLAPKLTAKSPPKLKTNFHPLVSQNPSNFSDTRKPSVKFTNRFISKGFTELLAEEVVNSNASSLNKTANISLNKNKKTLPKLKTKTPAERVSSSKILRDTVSSSTPYSFTMSNISKQNSNSEKWESTFESIEVLTINADNSNKKRVIKKDHESDEVEIKSIIPTSDTSELKK